MGRTVEELFATMSSREFAGWVAWEALYGLPDGYQTAGILGVEIRRAMGARDASAADFIPLYATFAADDDWSHDQSPEEARAILAAHVAAANRRKG